MNLDSFSPPTREDGDRVPAKEMAGRPLIVQVREHRTGIKTQFNSNPADASKYKPDGGEAVVLDVADINANSVYINVMWFNGAIVDSLKGYVASTLPVKLFYDTPKTTGNNAYLNVEALTGPELAAAQQWAAANPERFEKERAARVVAAQQNGGMPQHPQAPSQPPPWVPLAATPPAPAYAPPITAPPVAAPPAYTPPAPTYAPPAPVQAAPPAAPAAAGGVNVGDPAIAALLAQIAAQNAAK